MTSGRTFGITLVAALSLFVGVSGLIGSTAVITDGLGMTRIGTVSSAPSVGTTASPPASGMVDGRVVLFGVIRALLSMMLVVGAVGMLWVRPAGRRFSLAFAVGWIVLGGVEPFVLGYAFGWPVFISALYPFLLLALFNSPGWRKAFAPAEGLATPPPPTA